ncbi:protein fluG [Aristolochia californica]|uniref:protein fluG n=1 Tax=Aristolochia californica TaxID=171875 RepID=UPI0035D7C36B
METKYGELRAAVDDIDLFDAHAHNIVAIDSDFPFLRCFSEAESDALEYAPHTLSFKRSLRDIATLYGCEATYQGVQTYRRASGLQSISSKCFGAAKISVLLIDDGISFEKMHEVDWHRGFATTVGRIQRIERLAEMVLNDEASNGSKWTLDAFTEIFDIKLRSFVNEIVGLKSIAAYRSGLRIDTQVSKVDAEKGLIEDISAGKPVRVQNKSFIDYIFTHSLEFAVRYNLPMQVHTGFGDKDLDLRLSNPLHLRAVLEDKRFANCRIVLLHASYPFSKEASYLASVYSQVYLDFGLAVPKLSVHGMINSVKELLELAPLKKVMFSTDGYAFPETFYLGAKRAREVVFSVLRDACDEGDLTIAEAIEAAKDIFTKNAHHLYKIERTSVSSVSKSPILHNYASKLSDLLREDIVFVRVLWVDTSGQHRCRVVPANRFYEVVVNNGVGLTFASMGMTSFSDGPAEGTNLTGVGEIRLMPDLSTTLRLPWKQHEAMVLAYMHLHPGKVWEYCPREALLRVSKVLKDEFNLEMNAGFENEFYLLKNVQREGNSEWNPFDLTPYCSTSAFDTASPILQEIHASLKSMDITLEQVHAESGKGQYEIALGHTVCTRAADNLIFSREAVKAVARKHGLLATFVPKVFLDDIGSGSHVHLSLWEDGKNVFMASSSSETQFGMSKVGEEFMAGVLHHLPAILAFTAPLPNSYDRIQPNTWSGAYRCWGNENREAPLRTACPPGVSSGLVSNFELKSFDGCANPHLGLAAIMASGLDGLRRKLSLPEPINTNPSTYDVELERLPRELNESVAALRSDQVLKDLIGEKLLTAVTGVREAEIDYYSKNKEGYKQLIHRY